MTLPTTEQEFIDQEPEENRYQPEAADDSESEDNSYPIDKYDLVSSPNDFNTSTIVDFIDRGVIVIPGFQRNYVWDIKRASRLIESIIVGLPIPQIFLYEQERNKTLVIDGQQRLMSIYYFVKGRFPKKEKLAELRLIFDEQANKFEEVFSNDNYFVEFNLDLPGTVPGQPNKFHTLRYSGMDDEQKTTFDLRTIRNILVRQVGPAGDEAMYEIFNRLNSGGVNLTPQEIRRCMFDSKFYNLLYKTNTDDKWRKLVGAKVPDIHLKDVEILLRGFAMLVQGDRYRPSMVKFLNSFSKDARNFGTNDLKHLQLLLGSFLESCSSLPSDAFHSTPGRFSPMLFEAVFVAVCSDAYSQRQAVKGKIDLNSLKALKEDAEFQSATQRQTTSSRNVNMRLSRAKKILILD